MPETIAPIKIHHRAQDATFQRVHGGNLVYNACWEDPRIDRELMALDRDSRVVMITSAGCNALDYLLDDPAEIHAVDMNPRQNALLQLKSAMIRRGAFEDLFALFGEGAHPDFKNLRKDLSDLLPPYANRYWKEKHYYFKSSPLNPSFYYRGTAGQMAWIALKTFTSGRGKLRGSANAILEAKSIEEQQAIYEDVRPILWSKLVTWLLRQPVSMAMLGVPRAQVRLIEKNFDGGIPGFLQSKLEHVFTRIPFWKTTSGRSTSADATPADVVRTTSARSTSHPARAGRPYQAPQHHDREFPPRTSRRLFPLRPPRSPGLDGGPPSRSPRRGVAAHPREQPSQHGDPDALGESGDRFHSDFALERLELVDPDRTVSLHRIDRVGTYGCTLFARVTP